MRPAVSIGITTYNRAHLVSRAINSVLAQDYAPLSLVVVDEMGRRTTRRRCWRAMRQIHASLS